QRRGLRVHGEVRAVAVAVALERRAQVVGVLALELRHAVLGVGVAVGGDAVAAEAGVGDGFAALGIAGGGRGRGCGRLRRRLRAGAARQRAREESECRCVPERDSPTPHSVSPPTYKTAPNLTDSPGQMPHNRPRMIALIQRVTGAEVRVGADIAGAIGAGVLALIGVARGDTEAAAERLLERLLGYRIFADADGRMNVALSEHGGGLLLVPQ